MLDQQIGTLGMVSPGIAIPGILGIAIATALLGAGVGLVQSSAKPALGILQR